MSVLQQSHLESNMFFCFGAKKTSRDELSNTRRTEAVDQVGVLVLHTLFRRAKRIPTKSMFPGSHHKILYITLNKSPCTGPLSVYPLLLEPARRTASKNHSPSGLILHPSMTSLLAQEVWNVSKGMLDAAPNRHSRICTWHRIKIILWGSGNEETEVRSEHVPRGRARRCPPSPTVWTRGGTVSGMTHASCSAGSALSHPPPSPPSPPSPWGRAGPACWSPC